MVRTPKSPERRAQEALDVAMRRLTKARTRRDQLKLDLGAAEAEVTAAEKRRDYVAQNPDLPAVQKPDTYKKTTTAPGDGPPAAT
jgi:hypothetical protein